MDIGTVARKTPALLAAVIALAPLFAAAPADAARRHVAAGCGARGCGAVATTRGVVRAPVVGRSVVVVNPRRYWRPGGAIAAGAAIGFVAGATAVALAGNPPQPGYCWYYTDSSKTTGFWDVCP